MKFGTFAVTLMAAAAVGVAAGTVNASPSTPARELTSSGVDRGVAYHTTASEDDRVVTTTVDGGRFETAADGSRITLRSSAGETIAEVPTSFELRGHRLPMAQQISADGRSLSLAPAATAKDIGELQPIDPMSRLVTEVNENVVGMVAGGVVGGLIGAVLGLFWLSWLTGPIGALIGALAGGAIMGGQPFIDAMAGVVTGVPAP
ncbi:hypothetical protein [Nocardia sp. BMG51109]|uniref:hypothetical protein n=1 Tax=Nocardia sp. BMG51109 TaxID=1056816 RepID=UPI00046484C1|nr:hypothetical protein [Nocardia sp. BMG51109]